VTNPPIDSLRESIVMSLQTQIGAEANIFVPSPQHAEQIVLSSPILSQRKLRQIVALAESGVPNEFIDLQYDEHLGLEAALLRVCDHAETAVRLGKLVLLLSDRYLVKGKLPIHALLATGAVHHRLVATGLRCKCNILVETGTARDAHHFACLIGYGATAVYPYLAYQTLFDMMRKGVLKMEAIARQELGRSYRRGIRKGLFKIMSKMGICTVASYRSAQLFEIVGLGDEVVQLCFEGTESRTVENELFTVSRGLEEVEWWSVYRLADGTHLFDTYMPLVKFSTSRKEMILRYAGFDVPPDDSKDARFNDRHVVGVVSYASNEKVIREGLITCDDPKLAALLRSYADETRTLAQTGGVKAQMLRIAFSQNPPSAPATVAVLVPIVGDDLDFAHATLPPRMHITAWKR